jgi:hypothetical protein
MLAGQGTVHALETIQVLAAILAVAMVLFWRGMVKILIMLVLTVVIALFAGGVYLVIESLHG